MSFRVIKQVPFFRNLLYKLASARIQEKVRQLHRYLAKDEKIVDVGSGNCIIAHQLSTEGYQVTALDIANNSLIPDFQPTIFDGGTMPYADKEFDCALLITVLHHIPVPEKTIHEVARISKRILILEEVYSNQLTRFLTYFIDSLFNFEFINHPHSNKTEEGWERVFKQADLKVVNIERSRSLVVLQRVFYDLRSS